MLLLWTSFTEIDYTTGGGLRTFDIDEFALVRQPPIDEREDEDELLMIWQVNMDELL